MINKTDPDWQARLYTKEGKGIWRVEKMHACSDEYLQMVDVDTGEVHRLGTIGAQDSYFIPLCLNCPKVKPCDHIIGTISTGPNETGSLFLISDSPTGSVELDYTFNYCPKCGVKLNKEPT